MRMTFKSTNQNHLTWFSGSDVTGRHERLFCSDISSWEHATAEQRTKSDSCSKALNTTAMEYAYIFVIICYFVINLESSTKCPHTFEIT